MRSRRWEPCVLGACGRLEPGPEDEPAWPGRGGNAESAAGDRGTP